MLYPRRAFKPQNFRRLRWSLRSGSDPDLRTATGILSLDCPAALSAGGSSAAAPVTPALGAGRWANAHPHGGHHPPPPPEGGWGGEGREEGAEESGERQEAPQPSWLHPPAPSAAARFRGANAGGSAAQGGPSSALGAPPGASGLPRPRRGAAQGGI